MTKTVFLIGFLPNPRIYKRIAFASRHSDVHLICWDRGKEMMENPEGRGISCSIISIPAGNDPVSRLIPLKQFTAQSLEILKRNKPDIIHVQGLDMLQIACKYKVRHKNVHIIYEVADLHRLLVDKQKGVIRQVAQKYLLWQDNKCSQKIDLLIVTSQQYYDTYFASFIPKEKMMYFPNVPDLSAFDAYTKKNSRNQFTVGYFGVIRYKTELRLLINSLKKNNTRLIIAGYEESGTEIEELCRGRTDIDWIGRYDFKKSAADLYSRCDCIYAVYDASMANCQVALPNKLYEAVYCELPIIVADHTHVGDIVREWNVGIPVTHDSQEAVDSAILELKDDRKYSDYVAGCKQHKEEIDLERYNKQLKDKIDSFMQKND